jgi:hypothetical protein
VTVAATLPTARRAARAPYFAVLAEAIGHLEALAGQAHEETIEVVEPMRVLKVETSRVFDIIEDHTDFGRAILAVLADGLLARPRAEV